MAKESNAGERPATKNEEPVMGEHRFIQVGKHTKNNRIEFRVFLSRPDGKTVICGGGVFEDQDLYCLATTLSELARESVSGGWFWILKNENPWEGYDA